MRGRLTWLIAAVSLLLMLAAAFTLGYALGAKQEVTNIVKTPAHVGSDSSTTMILYATDPYRNDYWAAAVLFGVGLAGLGVASWTRRRRTGQISN